MRLRSDMGYPQHEPKESSEPVDRRPGTKAINGDFIEFMNSHREIDYYQQQLH